MYCTCDSFAIKIYYYYQTMFQYSLPVRKSYSIRYVHYRFSVLEWISERSLRSL